MEQLERLDGSYFTITGWLVPDAYLVSPVKARCVINEQLLLALLADMVSLEEHIDRTDFEARSSGSTQLTMNGI